MFSYVSVTGKSRFTIDLRPLERDSRKDEAVVFIFIFATAGLLIWAGIKPWVGKWVAVSQLSKPHNKSVVLIAFNG